MRKIVQPKIRIKFVKGGRSLPKQIKKKNAVENCLAASDANDMSGVYKISMVRMLQECN